MKKATTHIFKGCLFGILLFFTYTLQAQHTDTCFAKAPAEVGVGQTFKYSVTTAETGEIINADFGKFELINGPSMGTSTSISMINGQLDQTTRYTYTYYLSGEKEGEFTIPGVTFSFDGRVVKSNPVVVRVVKVPQSQPQEDRFADSWFNIEIPDMPSFSDFSFSWPFGSQRTDPEAENGKKGGKVQVEEKIGKDDMFLKATTTKMEAFQGEAIVITHKLYVKSDISGYSIQKAIFAPTEDFWLNALELSQRDQSTETVNGKTYNVYIVKQTAAYPTKTGKLVIPKLDLSLAVRVPAEVNDSFWGRINSYRNKEVKVTSNELTVKVKPLPGAKSDGTTEVVGNFTLNANLSTQDAHTHEAVVLTITISGSGNLHHIEADDFNIDFPADFDVTYPKVNAHISAKGDIITGTKTYKYRIIPREEGSYYIPGATFNYYDYDSGAYRTLTTQGFQVEVTPGQSKPSAPASEEPEKKSKPAKTYKI